MLAEAKAAAAGKAGGAAGGSDPRLRSAPRQELKARWVLAAWHPAVLLKSPEWTVPTAWACTRLSSCPHHAALLMPSPMQLAFWLRRRGTQNRRRPAHAPNAVPILCSPLCHVSAASGRVLQRGTPMSQGRLAPPPCPLRERSVVCRLAGCHGVSSAPCLWCSVGLTAKRPTPTPCPHTRRRA